MNDNDVISFRRPTKRDGQRVWRLIAACEPLDQNSLYCNILQCTHFADTCVAAERDGELVGWISAYRPPSEPETIFVWQVAVGASARGCGLGKRLLETLLAGDGAAGAAQLKTTITEDNAASWALFRSLAKELDANFRSDDWLDQESEFGGLHASEKLVTIAPLNDDRRQD